MATRPRAAIRVIVRGSGEAKGNGASGVSRGVRLPAFPPFPVPMRRRFKSVEGWVMHPVMDRVFDMGDHTRLAERFEGDSRSVLARL